MHATKKEKKVIRRKKKEKTKERKSIFCPFPSEPNGILLHYQVSVTDLHAPVATTEQQHQVESTMLQLGGLQQQRRYRITVTAFTAAGEGDPNFVEETSTVLVAPDPPVIILL